MPFEQQHRGGDSEGFTSGGEGVLSGRGSPGGSTSAGTSRVEASKNKARPRRRARTAKGKTSENDLPVKSGGKNPPENKKPEVYALKVIRAQTYLHLATVEEEVRLLFKLKGNPNVVEIFAGEIDGRSFTEVGIRTAHILLELADCDLRDYLEQRKAELERICREYKHQVKE